MFEHFVFREKYHWTWPLSLHYQRTLGFTSHIMTLLEQGYIQYFILDFCMKKKFFYFLFTKKSFPFNLNVSILTIFVHVGDGVVALSAGKTIW